ncbi:hypothetical protein HN51_004292 [Arachis hypogaea]
MPAVAHCTTATAVAPHTSTLHTTEKADNELAVGPKKSVAPCNTSRHAAVPSMARDHRDGTPNLATRLSLLPALQRRSPHCGWMKKIVGFTPLQRAFAPQPHTRSNLPPPHACNYARPHDYLLTPHHNFLPPFGRVVLFGCG